MTSEADTFMSYWIWRVDHQLRAAVCAIVMLTSSVQTASERHYSAKSAVSGHTGISHFIAHFSGQLHITLRSHYIHWAMSCLLDMMGFHVPKLSRYVALHDTKTSRT